MRPGSQNVSGVNADLTVRLRETHTRKCGPLIQYGRFFLRGENVGEDGHELGNHLIKWKQRPRQYRLKRSYNQPRKNTSNRSFPQLAPKSNPLDTFIPCFSSPNCDTVSALEYLR